MKYKVDVSLIKEALKEKNITYADLADILTKNNLPMTEAGIKLWFRKKEPRRPEMEKCVFLAKFLEIPFDVLIKQDIFDMKIPLKKVRVIGEASCGVPILSVYQDDEFLYVGEDEWNPDLYAVIASGDSMLPEINDGDRLVCDPNVPLMNGDLVHYTLFEESAVKVYVKDEKANILQFKPINHNPTFLTVNILPSNREMLDNLTMAKVVKISRDVMNNRNTRLRMIGL